MNFRMGIRSRKESNGLQNMFSICENLGDKQSGG